MNNNNFFKEINRIPYTYKEHKLNMPLFYQNIKFLSILLLVSAKKIEKILPSKRIKPYQITPFHTALSIAAYQHKKSDLGEYNEILISVPITIDKKTPMFVGSLTKIPEAPMLYTHSLPVTSEIAQDIGLEMAGYPKFMADIDFIEEKEWISCQLKLKNQSILTLRGRKLDTKKISRSRASLITFREGFLLRSEFILSERNIGNSKNGKNVILQFGEHPISKQLQELSSTQILSYEYSPYSQGILTPVIESFEV